MLRFDATYNWAEVESVIRCLTPGLTDLDRFGRGFILTSTPIAARTMRRLADSATYVFCRP